MLSLPASSSGTTGSTGSIDVGTVFTGIDWQSIGPVGAIGDEDTEADENDSADASGSAGLTQTGSGTLIVSGSNTYTGDTILNGGTLGGTGVLGATMTLDFNSGSLSPGDTNGQWLLLNGDGLFFATPIDNFSFVTLSGTDFSGANITGFTLNSDGTLNFTPVPAP